MKSTNYKNKYAAEHYDQVRLLLPKGKKAQLQALAAEKGMSLNAYLCSRIFGDQEEILDRMQIAAKYRKMILSVSGNSKEGYTVILKDGYINSATGGKVLTARTKPELRAAIKRYLVQDTI